MRTTIYLALLCTIFSLSVQAQSDRNEQDSLELWQLMQIQAEPARLGFDYVAQAATDDISMKHLWMLGFSDMLENEEKEELLKGLIHESRIGYAQQFDVIYDRPSYPTLDGKIRKGYSLGYRNSIYTAAVFPRHTAQLFLQGNKPYTGEELEMDGTEYEDWWYSSIYYRHIFRDDSLKIDLQGGLVLGHSYRALNLVDGEIYTAENGEYIDVDLSYNLQQTAQTLPLAGLGINLAANTEFPLSDDYNFQLSFQDLGWVYWNEVEQTVVDSNFRFRGMTFNNIFEINDSLIAREREALEKGFLSNETGNYWTMLPWQIQARLIRKSDHMNVENFYGEVSYRHLSSFVPRLALGINFRVNGSDTRKVQTELAYGGFNTIALGAYYKARLGDHFYLKAGSSNVLAAILPAVATGSSLALSMHYIF